MGAKKHNAVLFAAGFQGMLTVQAFNYYDNFPNDRWSIKFMVVVTFSSITRELT